MVLVTKMRAQKIGNLDGMIHDIPFSYLSPDNQALRGRNKSKNFWQRGIEKGFAVPHVLKALL